MYVYQGGGSNTLVLNITTDQDKYEISAQLASELGWNGGGAVDVTVRIASGVTISHTSAGTTFLTGALPSGSTVLLDFQGGTGAIRGLGGTGGAGGVSGMDGSPGTAGRAAINTQAPLRIKLGSSGVIFGGGGGGGGGGVGSLNQAGGGGGGGGDDPGIGGAGSGGAGSGSTGTTLAGGAGGLSIGNSGDGGAGGNPGAAGTAGSNGTSSSGGAGGAAGAAIILNGNPITWLGPQNEATSQPSTTQVKGTVA